MKRHITMLCVLAAAIALLAEARYLSSAYATEFGVYSETARGCTLYDDPAANSRLGIYYSPVSTITLLDSLAISPEGDRSMWTRIYVRSAGWAGWFVQWGVEWETDTVTVDMSAYDNGYLKLWVRTPVDLKVGIRSGNIEAGYERSKVNLSNYCSIDSTWQSVSIPMSTFKSRDPLLDFSKMKILLNVAREGGTTDTTCFWIDNVRWERFHVVGVSPNKGLNSGIVSARIGGQGFEANAGVKLVMGTRVISGTTSAVANNEISTTFDLTDAPIGSYDVVVTNPDYQTARMSNGFEVRLQKPQSTGPIKIAGRRILVDGTPFSIKGVDYAPTPIGYSPEAGWNLPDYGSSDIGIYDRDFAILGRMNCNAIRTWGDVPLALLDKAKEYDLRVICGFWIDYGLNLADTLVRTSLIDSFRTYVSNRRDKSAVLMWSIGNEQNFQNGNNAAWYTLVNELARVACEEEGASYHPVTTPNGELNNIGEAAVEADDLSMNYLDVWGANVYRGLSFGTLFSQFPGRSSKALWISEYGIDAWDHQSATENQEIQAIYASALWDEIVRDSAVCLGGSIMAYSDEWWKNGAPASHDPGGQQTPNFPDGWSDEEYWGVVGVGNNGDGLDEMCPRVTYYTLQSRWGTADSLQLESVVPSTAPNRGDIRVRITGHHFQARPTIRLIKDQLAISGTGTVVQTPDTSLTTLSLTDAALGMWSLVVTNRDSQSDTLLNAFTVTPSDTAALGTPVVVCPNPFVSSGGDARITFKGYGVIRAVIRIYSISGELVRTLREVEAVDTVTWDGRNDDGDPLVSGVYAWISEGPVRTNKGKIVMLR